MGELFNLRKKIEQVIKDKKLDEFKTKGKITMECGLLLALITEDTPDDAVRIGKLKAAAKEILGIFREA